MVTIGLGNRIPLLIFRVLLYIIASVLLVAVVVVIVVVAVAKKRKRTKITRDRVIYVKDVVVVKVIN